MTTTKKIRTSIYLDEEVKNQAKKLFKKYHLSLSDAVTIFLSQSVLEQGLPFKLKLPKNIEMINPSENDYRQIEITRGEETISLEEFKQI